MSRALMSATIADQAGNAIQGAVVAVYETGGTTPVGDMFAASSGGSPITALTSDSHGLIKGWFTVGRLVDLKVTDNGHAAYRPASPSVHLTFADYTITVPAVDVSTDMATQAELDAEATLRVSGDAASVATAAADATAKVAVETTARGTAVTAEAAARVAGDAASVATAAADATTKANAAQAASQPLDSDLTAIAALTTTTYGRALLALADAAAGRTALGLGTAAVAASTAFDAAGAAAAAQAASQPVDSDLTAIAALSTTAFGRSFLDRADAAAARTLLGLGTAATTDSTTYMPVGSAKPKGASVSGTDVVNVAADVAAGRILSTRIKIPAALSSPNVLSYLRGWWDGADPRANGGASFPTTGTYEAWVDKSSANGNIGNLTQATQAKQPLWTANAVNGKGAYLFPGATQAILFQTAVFSALSSLGSTFFMVAKLGSASTAVNLFDTVAGQGARRIVGPASNSAQIVWQLYGGTTQRFSNGTGITALADTGVAVLIAQFPASGIGRLRRNGSTIVDNQSIGFGSPPTQLWVGGGQGSSGLTNNGAVCEFGIIDRNMLIDEIKALEAYLIAKWCPDAYIAFPQGGSDNSGIQPTAVVPGPTNTPGTAYGVAPASFKVTFPYPHRFTQYQLLTAASFTPSAWNGTWVVGEVLNACEIIVRTSVLSTFSVSAANTAGAPTAGNMGTVATFSGRQMHVYVSPDAINWVDRYGAVQASADIAVNPTAPDIRNGESFKWTNPDGSITRYLVTSNTNFQANAGLSLFRCDDPLTQVPVNWYWVQDLLLPNHLENVNTNGAWGCTAFIDTAGDGNVHVVVPSGIDNVTFTLYELHPLTSDLSGAWSSWTALTFTGANQPLAAGQSAGGTTAVIDPFIFPKGQIDASHYFMLYKREKWVTGAITSGVWDSGNGGEAVLTVSPGLAQVVYVGGHVELGGRGTVWAPSGWNGIWAVTAVNAGAGTITVAMAADPGATTIVGDLSIEFIELAQATTITGPYTVLQIGDWAGWGRAEATKALVTDANNIKVYFDNGPGSTATSEVGNVSVTTTGLTGNGATVGSSLTGTPWSAPAGLVVTASPPNTSARKAGQISSWPHSGSFATGSVIAL